jgi:threonine dehydrogenase-like Zn-dependent dehydrogenase
MRDAVRAMVLTGPGALELREFERPQLGEDDALLRVEACGICGTDAEVFAGNMRLAGPVIPGHEPVGRIEAIGARAAVRWQVAIGDRVVMQSDFGCGRCAGCLAQRECLVSPGTYGFVPTGVAPALWGGYAELMYLAPGSVPHRIDARVPPHIAALYNALGAGFAWAVEAPRLRAGDAIAIFGPGQRGLACVIAAKLAGASQIFVTGIGSRDAHKLALARELGADVAIDVEREDAVARTLAATRGAGVDVAVDTTPHAPQPLIDAVRITRPGGTIVVAGLKGRAGVAGFPSDELAMRYQTLRGVRAVDYRSFQLAVRAIEAGRVPVERLHTHRFPLADAALAVRTLTAPERSAIAVAIEPCGDRVTSRGR